jgi:hypothetical protein
MELGGALDVLVTRIELNKTCISHFKITFCSEYWHCDGIVVTVHFMR